MKTTKSKAVRAIEAQLHDAKRRHEIALQAADEVAAEVKALRGAIDAATEALTRPSKAASKRGTRVAIKQAPVTPTADAAEPAVAVSQ